MDERGKRAVKSGGIPEERVGKKRAPGEVKERVRTSATRERSKRRERERERRVQSREVTE